MTIGRRFLIAGVIAILALVAISVLSVWGINETAKSSVQISTIGTAIRNHLEADMMHDALRADALLALREGKMSREHDAYWMARVALADFNASGRVAPGLRSAL